MDIQFPTYQIVKDYFNTNFKLAYEYDADFDSCFEKNDTEYKNIFQNIHKIKPIFFEWKNYRFPVFIYQNDKELYTKERKISFDIYLNVFLFLSGWQEVVCSRNDIHGRFPFVESLQSKFDFIKTPVVNIYFELLYEVALEKDIAIERKVFDKSIIFTHDIDQMRSGWFENIQYEMVNFSFKSLWRIPRNIFVKSFGLKDDYYKGMEKMLAIDKQNNVDAISFLLVEKSHKDADFDIENTQFSEILKQTLNVQEIGIHPGYATFDNATEYRNQISKLENISNKQIIKSRQHFLCYDVLKTPFIQEEIGVIEDYTLGFAEQYGFRNGIVSPFYLFNFKEGRIFDVLQIPLVFMDVSLINYNLDKEFSEVLSFLTKLTREFNCNFSVLFHNSVFSDGKYAGFEELYLEMIKMNN